jgi:hypothetical protein
VWGRASESGSENPTCVFCDLAKRNQQTNRSSWCPSATRAPKCCKRLKQKCAQVGFRRTPRACCACVRCWLLVELRGQVAQSRRLERKREAQQQPRFQRYSSQTFDASLVHAAAKIYAAGEGNANLGINVSTAASLVKGISQGTRLNETFSIWEKIYSVSLFHPKDPHRQILKRRFVK